MLLHVVVKTPHTLTSVCIFSYFFLKISFGTDQENQYKNQEHFQLVIISVIFLSWLIQGEIVRRNQMPVTFNGVEGLMLFVSNQQQQVMRTQLLNVPCSLQVGKSLRFKKVVGLKVIPQLMVIATCNNHHVTLV